MPRAASWRRCAASPPSEFRSTTRWTACSPRTSSSPSTFPWANSAMDGYAARAPTCAAPPRSARCGSGSSSTCPPALPHTCARPRRGDADLYWRAASRGRRHRRPPGGHRPRRRDGHIVRDRRRRQHPPRGRGRPGGATVLRPGAPLGAGAARRAGVARRRAPPGLSPAPGGDPGQRRRNRGRGPARRDPERAEDREQQHAHADRAGAPGRGEPVNLGIARDTPESLREHLGGRWIAISSSPAPGSVSASTTTSARVLDELGAEQRFWRLRMRPGAPVGFGPVDDMPPTWPNPRPARPDASGSPESLLGAELVQHRCARSRVRPHLCRPW